MIVVNMRRNRRYIVRLTIIVSVIVLFIKEDRWLSDNKATGMVFIYISYHFLMFICFLCNLKNALVIEAHTLKYLELIPTIDIMY